MQEHLLRMGKQLAEIEAQHSQVGPAGGALLCIAFGKAAQLSHHALFPTLPTAVWGQGPRP